MCIPLDQLLALRAQDPLIEDTSCAAYLLYIHITKRQREKLTPEIMRLADELIR